MNTPPVTLAYHLTGTGWARCELRIGEAAATVTASYLRDALGDLARNTLRTAEGEAHTRFSFDEEPGEFRWLLDRAGDELRVRILEFPSTWSQAPDESGTLRLDAHCPVDAFVRAVVDALERVLAEWGADGYRAQWLEHAFPLQALTQLRERIAEDRESTQSP